MTPDTPVWQLQLDPTGRIAQDVLCIHCGYNLRSLLPNQACPECNHLVEPSLRGQMLRFSNPAWLAKLAWGMVWLILGRVLEIVIFVFQYWLYQLLLQRLATGTMAVVEQTLVYPEQVAGFIGVWMVTWPDPRTPDNPSSLDARVLARVLLVASYTLQNVPWHAALPWRPVPGSIGYMLLWLIPGMIWLAGWICLYVHLARLARRIPTTALVWLTYTGVAAMIISSCYSDSLGLWQMFDRAAGRFSIAPPWVCALEWCLPLAYMALLLAVQILYRRQFRRALRQSTRRMQEVDVQLGASAA